MDKEFWESFEKKKNEILDNLSLIRKNIREMQYICDVAPWPGHLSNYIMNLDNKQDELDEMCKKSRDLIFEMREIYSEKLRVSKEREKDVE